MFALVSADSQPIVRHHHVAYFCEVLYLFRFAPASQTLRMCSFRMMRRETSADIPPVYGCAEAWCCRHPRIYLYGLSSQLRGYVFRPHVLSSATGCKCIVFLPCSDIPLCLRRPQHRQRIWVTSAWTSCFKFTFLQTTDLRCHPSYLCHQYRYNALLFTDQGLLNLWAYEINPSSIW